MSAPDAPSAPEPVDAAALRDLALAVAREGAALVRERRAGVVEVAATKTSDIDVVTEADRACEALLRERIAAARPHDAFLGEESADDEHAVPADGVRWIVDPIDGTVNFLYDLGQYSVCVAAEVTTGGVSEVVAGVVVDVPTGIEYEAVLGGGARRDGVPLAVRGPAPMAERLLCTGFSYDRRIRVLQAEAWVRLLPHVRDLRRRGSAALDLCLVAEGRVDGYVEEGVHLWDHAAAGLVAREAGARTRVLPGVGGLDLLVCGPSHGFDELVAIVEWAGFSAGTAAE
ncbi:inositol monophosphatase family protein [uncultured Nocardioides sp.]|uniref:inositol monophosphatase family protein n=1 Tax=uncultured Nocardioides sp. TaxID=198441 RepID=UPI002614B480|nr:inositol monophosphatase family protein [uncultured Nocardioides sp.]